MFFWPPFVFLIPLILIIIAIKFGSRIFRDLFDDDEGPRKPYSWLFGPRFNRRLPFQSSWRERSGDIEAVIFRLAYKLKGRITLSDIVLETGLSLKAAEKTIDQMVDGVRIRMEVDERGLVVYEFPEIISRFEDG